MVDNNYLLMKDRLIEQKITKEITIADGAEDIIEINIPDSKTVFLKGYGYTWFSGSSFWLDTTNKQFPKRTDQEGSPAMPVIYGTPYPIKSGGKISLRIKNDTSASRTYDVVFYLLTNDYLNEESTGGQLIVPTSSSGGTISGSVYITDSSGVTPVDVVTRADSKKALCIDATLIATDVLVCSTDQTEGNARFLKVATDGTIVMPSVTVTATDLDVRDLTTTDEITNTEKISARTPTHSAIAIASGGSAESCLALNADRKSALFQNISDTIMYLSVTGVAVTETGIFLPAYGSWSMSNKEDNLSTGAVSVICATTGKKLLVTEWD